MFFNDLSFKKKKLKFSLFKGVRGKQVSNQHTETVEL